MTHRKINARLDALEARVDVLEGGRPEPRPVFAVDVPVETEGIDVYHRTSSGSIDWEKVASAARFAIVKVSEGQDCTDPRAGDYLAGAKAAGLLVGVYHFARPDSVAKTPSADAKAEAEDCLAAIVKTGVELDNLKFESGRTAAVWLDLERDAPKLSKAEGLRWCLEWCATVER